MQGVARGKGQGAGGQRDVVGLRRDPAEIDPRIVHLAHVAEVGVAQRNVAAPQRGVSKLFGAAGKAFLAEHRRLVAGESLDREEHTERQPIRRANIR